MKAGRSSSTLPVPDPAVLADLPLDGGCDPCGDSHPPKHAAHMPWRYSLFAGNLAEIRESPIMLAERVDIRDKLGVQIDASVTEPPYAKWNNVASKIIPSRFDADAPPSLGQAILKLRKSLGYSQMQLALALSVSQGNVAKWEKGKLKPPGQILALLARLAPEDESAWWLLQAGVKLEDFSYEESLDRTIPVLKDAAAAGTARMVDDAEVEYKLNLPRHLVPRGGKLVGLKVRGDSMSPILEDGYIALVDVSRRDPADLLDRMVAATNGDGVTLKWLRKYDDLYVLVPNNTSTRHPVRVIKANGDWHIVGEVVKWIGAPASTPKRK